MYVFIYINQTGITPVASDCIAWWAPQDEKLTMSSLTYTGLSYIRIKYVISALVH